MNGDANSSGRGGAEEEVQEHEEMSLEAQPGGGRYKTVEGEYGRGEEETGAGGVVSDAVRDGMERHPDRTICDDCV